MSEEIKEVLEGVTQEVRTFQSEEIAPIKERLASLEERSTSASDEKVTDLEKRLLDAEQKGSELIEKVRLIEAGHATPVVKSESAPFRGMFIKNIDEVERAIFNGETRAIEVGDIAGGGKMTAEQASSFLDYVVGDQSTLSVIENRIMSGPTADLDVIGATAQKLILATESDNAALDTNGVTFATRTLSTTEAIWAEDISLSFIEDNIAGGGAEQQIASVVGKAVGSDLNDLAWNGDTTTGPFLIINDGFEALTDADTTVLDTGSQSGIASATDVMSDLYNFMPSQYRMAAGQTMFVNPGLATNYMDELGTRATGLGDQVLTNGSTGLRYFGVPIVADRHVPNTNAYMTPRDNLVFGIQRNVTSETFWNARRRRIELTVTVRFDFQHKFGGIISRAHTIDNAALH